MWQRAKVIKNRMHPSDVGKTFWAKRFDGIGFDEDMTVAFRDKGMSVETNIVSDNGIAMAFLLENIELLAEFTEQPLMVALSDWEK